MPIEPDVWAARGGDRRSWPAVDLGLYDAAGRRLVTLLREPQSAGEHRIEWSHGLRPGVYFAVLRLAQETLARTAVVAR